MQEHQLPSRQDVRDALVSILAGFSPLKPEVVEDTMDLEVDLSFNSLALVELGLAMEELFKLGPIAPEVAINLHCVDDVVSLLDGLVHDGEAVVPSAHEIADYIARYGME